MKDLIANFYEVWGFNYLGAFSDIMFSNDFNTVIVLYTLPTVLVLTAVYYYVIDRPKTSKLWVWITWLFGVGLIAFGLAFITVENSFYGVGIDPAAYRVETVIFSVTNLVWSILIMFLFSILIKWKSTNSSHVPF
ncbi:membrane protein [Cellulophaga algicola DSM 14237]|uniref:Membrane protein n=1 Tax=Cellulophaga algicola (strain DSM 14237 / IC166 / ACAM 630) TaxID=688270 RepID=E6XEV4_CELAD|nr:hypothetical protein [Cellulophaga algicola]ADV48156.1 membrane protein [Cellulophaga algicola DSM 14237]